MRPPADLETPEAHFVTPTCNTLVSRCATNVETKWLDLQVYFNEELSTTFA